jgi:hypothetical protein
MVNKSNPMKIILPVLILAAAAGFWLPAEAGAADTGQSIRTITPVGEGANYSSRVNMRAEDYFDVVGILNLIESDRVVIGDRELTLTGSAKTYRVELYNEVGAKLNSDGEAVVIDLISDEPN